ncbi:hypothetical protein C8J55DRAFT_502168, partial [Lentinula edodes]
MTMTFCRMNPSDAASRKYVGTYPNNKIRRGNSKLLVKRYQAFRKTVYTKIFCSTI